MITVSVKIDRPINTVWDYFTTPSNWTKWYGGSIKEVDPSWQKGSKIFWSLGDSSLIEKIIPGQEICISGAFMDTRYNFKPEGGMRTIVEVIQSDPKGGAFFTDGGAAEKAKWGKKIRKLKECVENEISPEKEKDKIACIKCGYFDFEYDNYWKEYNCKKCGWTLKDNWKTSELNKNRNSELNRENIITNQQTQSLKFVEKRQAPSGTDEIHQAKNIEVPINLAWKECAVREENISFECSQCREKQDLSINQFYPKEDLIKTDKEILWGKTGRGMVVAIIIALAIGLGLVAVVGKPHIGIAIVCAIVYMVLKPIFVPKFMRKLRIWILNCRNCGKSNYIASDGSEVAIGRAG